MKFKIIEENFTTKLWQHQQLCYLIPKGRHFEHETVPKKVNIRMPINSAVHTERSNEVLIKHQRADKQRELNTDTKITEA